MLPDFAKVCKVAKLVGIRCVGDSTIATDCDISPMHPAVAAQPAAPEVKAGHSRIRELDGLRGMAILLVLGAHFFARLMLRREWSGLAALVLKITTPGWLGVDLFFVLSGFLITGILLNTKGARHYTRNFYMRRVLRILPLYSVVLTILAVFYSGSEPAVLLGLAMSLNLAPIFHIAIPSGGGALWSLAVEEHFYLIWPWVVRTLKPSVLGIVCVLICTLEPAIRVTFRLQTDVYFYSWFRFDGLAWGGLIAVLTHWRRKPPAAVNALLIAAPLVALAAGASHGIMHRGTALGRRCSSPWLKWLSPASFWRWSPTPEGAPWRYFDRRCSFCLATSVIACMSRTSW
jgi:peptidoglycan/LPS O-acetylase OafA/YrhL